MIILNVISYRLLYAYFGISLQINRRSKKTLIQSALSVKRKCHRILKPLNKVMLIGPESSYPYIEESSPTDCDLLDFEGYHPRGLMLQKHRYFAYRADEKFWDYYEHYDDNEMTSMEIPWKINDPQRFEKRSKIFDFWNKIPFKNRAYLDIVYLVEYTDILAVDEIGDEYTGHCCKIYIPFDSKSGPLVRKLNFLADADSLHPTRFTEASMPLDEKSFKKIPYFLNNFKNNDH